MINAQHAHIYRIHTLHFIFGEIFFLNFFNTAPNHGYILEKNHHPWRRQPWPLPPLIGYRRPFCSRGHVDRAMGNAPYRWCHEILAGVDVLRNNPPWQFFTK